MTPALTVEATAERAAERRGERTAKNHAAGPRPDDRQTQLIGMVRERDAAGTTRQLQAWVHRRGLDSLQAFRQTAVPNQLSAADDAWLEGCLQRPLAHQAPAQQAPFSGAGADSPAGPAQGAAAGPLRPLGMETSPTGQASIPSPGDCLIAAASPEASPPFPSIEERIAAGLASDDQAGPHPQELVEPRPGASFNTEIDARIKPEIGVASGTVIPGGGVSEASVEANPEFRPLDWSAELAFRDSSDAIAREPEGVVAPSASAVDSAHGDEPRGIAPESPQSQATGAPMPFSCLEEISSATPSGASQPQGLERGISSAGAVLADAPQRLRRKLVGSFGKARVLMRACFEEAISTLHPHGEMESEAEEPLPSGAAAAEGSARAGAPEQLGSSRPSLNSPAAAAAQQTSQPTDPSAPNGTGPSWVAPPGAAPRGADGTDAAPMAAWSHSLASSLPAASLDVPLQGPPAPAPAHLADLRAWLPGSSGQDRRAS